MGEYRRVTIPFKNLGLVQKLDPGLLNEGQYVELKNAISVQEGAISSRYGATKLTEPVSSPGSLIHTMHLARLGPATSQQYLFVGEGDTMYRVRVDQLSSAFTSLLTSIDTWAKRWTGAFYKVGATGKGYFFSTASQANGMMKKDPILNAAGSATTSTEAADGFSNWGIKPPAAAPAVALGSLTQASKTIGSGPFEFDDWDTESYTVKSLDITSLAVDLSSFTGGAPSGVAANGYDSEDYIEIVMTPKNPLRFDWFIIQFDVSSSGGAYNDYYEKYIIPFTGTGMIARQADPLGAAAERTGLDDSGLVGDGPGFVTPVPGVLSGEEFDVIFGKRSTLTDQTKPVEMPPTSATDSGTPQAITVKIPKKDFVKVGAAGGTGKTWANVKHVRMWGRSLVIPANNFTCTVTSVTLKANGGLSNKAANRSPYRWLYTYRNDATGHESNPCPLMVEGSWVQGVEKAAIVLSGIPSSSDAQVTSIPVYRAGGAYADGEYRLVGYAAAGEFTDTLSDADIVYSRFLEFDNDPPVTSDLKVALSATMAAVSAPGQRTIALTVSQPSGLGNLATILTVGTRLRVIDAEKSEQIQITAINNLQITAYFQHAHASGVKVTAESAIGKPCRLTLAAMDSMFLAGDDVNPHILYKSKKGRPEAFPTIVEATGASNRIAVGSPANPIMAIEEFGGEVVCLNLESIYTVAIWGSGDQMQPPQQTPAHRGLLHSAGYCKGDNAIYYLSHDGVYAWAGGQSIKISEEIDWFFNGKTVGGIPPMDKTADQGSPQPALDYVRMAYDQNQVHLICRDTSGDTWKWVYDTLYRRWRRDNAPPEGAGENDASAYTSLVSFQDRLYSARAAKVSGETKAHVYLEKQGTSDASFGIPFAAQTGFFHMGDPTLSKSFGDILIELTAPVDLTIKTYYNYSATEDQTLVVSGASGRRMIPIPIQSGSAKEARAVAFRFEGTSTNSGGITLHSMTFNWLPLAEVQRGKAYDFDHLGYPWDKRLDQLVIEYDTGGQNVTMNLDVVHGITGSTTTATVAQFTLNSNGRAKAALPIQVKTSPPAGFTAGDPIVCKMARLKPSAASSTDFKIWDYHFTYEKYPPDITLHTDPSDYGNPYQKYWQQLVIDVDTGGQAATCEVFIDDGTSSDATKYQSLSINTTSKTRQQTLTLNPAIEGKKARLKITPHASGKFQLFSHNFVTAPADKGPVVHTFDWDNLGWPWDKRLKSVTFEYEVTSQTTMRLFALQGNGSTQSSSEITSPTITLSTGGRRTNTVQLNNAGSGASGPIAKMIRFQPNTTNTAFKSWKYTFDFEKLPPDVVSETEWTDGGYLHEKYLQQVELEIDTGGVACRVDVCTDLAASPEIKETFTVTTSDSDRVRLITIPSAETDQVTYSGTEAAPPIQAKNFRLRFTPGANGKSQLYKWRIHWVKATPGPVEHSFDWDTLGHPYDKRLKSVTIEYDTNGTANVQVALDTLTGLAGATINSAARTLVLSGTGRGVQTFDLYSSGDLIAKAVRLRPVSIPIHNFRMWRYVFDKDDYPKDITKSTDWDDLDYRCEKILQSVSLTVDTGGVAASVQLQKDGGTAVKTFTVNTSSTNRTHIETLHSATEKLNIGNRFRLIVTPGNGGKFQLFNYQFNRTLEPCPLTRWDSYEQYLGAAGWRYIKQIWVEYRCAAPITFHVYKDNGELFHSEDLPLHTYREVERFSLPSSASGGTLNKSKGYRFVIVSSDPDEPFYLYRDSTRVEVMELSGPQRAAFRNFVLWELIPIQK